MPITVKDLSQVYEATFDARSKWRNVLLALGVQKATIDSIGVRWRDNPEDCYREGLSEWLCGGERTWNDLARALSSPTVEYKLLAANIKQKKTSHLAVKEWRKGKDMPIKMGSGIQNVVIGAMVYVGGGDTLTDHDRATVMKLDLQREQWSKLPQHNAIDFCMVSVMGKLMLIGGQNQETRLRSNQVAVFDSNRWMFPYLPMNTARSFSTAVTYNDHIIVAGGVDDQGRITSSVEVFDIAANHWYATYSLNNPQDRMKSVIVKDTLYLMGGITFVNSGVCPTTTVYKIDARKLVGNSISGIDVQESSRLCSWETVESTPFQNSTPLSTGDFLIAIGGCDSRNPHPSIHIYSPDNESWMKCGELPSARYDCACSLLPNGSVIVAGGEISKYNFLDTVSFFTLTYF